MTNSINGTPPIAPTIPAQSETFGDSGTDDLFSFSNTLEKQEFKPPITMQFKSYDLGMEDSQVHWEQTETDFSYLDLDEDSWTSLARSNVLEGAYQPFELTDWSAQVVPSTESMEVVEESFEPDLEEPVEGVNDNPTSPALLLPP